MGDKQRLIEIEIRVENWTPCVPESSRKIRAVLDEDETGGGPLWYAMEAFVNPADRIAALVSALRLEMDAAEPADSELCTALQRYMGG
jgi:hypothetical protein